MKASSEIESRGGRKWTQREVNRLIMMWGNHSTTKIGDTLGRTQQAVYDKAKHVGLGGNPNKGRMSVYRLQKEYGYTYNRVIHACEHLGVRLVRGHIGSRFSRPMSRRPRRYIPESRLEEVLEYLKTVPDGKHLFSTKNPKRTHPLAWGTGTKPPACVDCGRSDVPYRESGRCKKCSSRWRVALWRAKKRAEKAGKVGVL